MTIDSFDNATLLVGIGAPRTGTKWLSAYFAQHPEILMSPLRILHYFDARYSPEENGFYHERFSERLSLYVSRATGRQTSRGQNDKLLTALQDRVRMASDEAAYLEYFRNQWSGEPILCDITPSYCTLGREAFKGMHRMHTRVRLLFCMRNPIDRWWSGLRLKYTRDPNQNPYDELDRRTDGGNVVDRAYQLTITNLDAAVPADAVKYVFFEEFFDQPAIDQLCEFLGVTTFPADVGEALNQSTPMKLDENRRRLAYRKFEPVYRFVRDRFNGELPTSWLEDMERFTS